MSVTTKLLNHLNIALDVHRGTADTAKRKNTWANVVVIHANLLKALRETRRKDDYKHPTPEWERFPLARDFFTQCDGVGF